MKQDTYDQTDELARLQAENARLKAQMAELTAQLERKDDVRMPQERKRKMPRTNTDSKVQLTGESYLNSRREHWRNEIEKDPALRKNTQQNRRRQEIEDKKEIPEWGKWLGYLAAASVALLVIWQSGLIIPLGIIGLISAGILKVR